ncbi:MAG: YceI family protein [Bacteroidetes bacterium]|nr:MAG: YceI family protein [Bacteroidota bacterium]
MVKNLYSLIALTIACLSFSPPSPGIYTLQSSSVSFLSAASFGKIKGMSDKLTGTLDVAKRTFEFRLPACSFEGFLNPAQKKHYCEKFVEGAKYPETGFKGKIIEDIDLTVPGTYSVRGKGMFLLHGVEKERIIDTQITVKGGQITIESKIKIPVEEHGIKVSKMNSLSMAKIVNVDIKIIMIPG